MRCCLYVFTFILTITVLQSLIIPDEIPTILSVIWSNIPILKKGTDSRLGWGFRLGNRADFQVLVELGPQQYTQPLANQEDKGGNNKRNTVNSLANTLYAQRQKEKKEQEEQVADTPAGQWLERWSKNAQKQRDQDEIVTIPEGAKPGFGVGEIDAKSVIPDDDSSAVLTGLFKKDSRKLEEDNIKPLIDTLKSLLKEQTTEELKTSSDIETVTAK